MHYAEKWRQQHKTITTQTKKKGGKTMSDEEILIAYFGGRPQWSGNKLYKIGDLRVEYSGTTLYKVGGARIEFSGNKLYKVNGERVQWSGDKVYKIGDRRI